MSSAASAAVEATPRVEDRRRRRHARRSRGVTALMYAAQQGDVDRVRRIIRAQSSSLFDRDRTGKTTLHYCCTSDNLCAAHAADILVMAAPDLVESRDEDGFTPLHLAVIAGNMQLVTFLLANNADVNAVDNEKHTVVHWATVCGETAALRAVLAAGAPASSPDVHGGYPLHYAAQMCGGPNNDRDSSLGMQVLQALLTHKDIDVSVTDGDKRQPLLWAASAGSAKAVLALVRAGAAVEAADKDGLTALHCAASRGHTNCLDTLLTLCGASPDVIDSNGCTALHYAVTLGHADATALLLAHGADPNRQDRKGRSPAHCGCAKGQFETVKLIGAHRAKLWLRNARGDLPLHEAAASGRRELVKWLLEMRPSQVNARNNDGRCPLHMAALNDNADMCKILLDAGAQVNPVLRSSRNVFMTPLDCALQRGFRSTAKFLQLHGGVPASRLAELRNQPGSALNLQIRDDVTFWGDTSSESETEKGDTIKSGKKSYRKRISHKLEKAKVNLAGSDDVVERLDSSKLTRRTRKSSSSKTKDRSAKGENSSSPTPTKRSSSRKLPSSRMEYTNEIIINGKTEINIHQTREIIVEKDPVLIRDIATVVPSETVISQSASSVNDGRPRSAKFTKEREKSGKSSAEKDATKSQHSITSPKTVLQEENESRQALLKTQSTNTSEETADTVIENKNIKVSTIVPEDDVIKELLDTKKIMDQQSLKSNTSEDVEEHKEFVVEASIHEPPKSQMESKLDEPEDLNKKDSETTAEKKEQEEAATEPELLMQTHNENVKDKGGSDTKSVDDKDLQKTEDEKADKVTSTVSAKTNIENNKDFQEELKVQSDVKMVEDGNEIEDGKENKVLKEINEIKDVTVSKAMDETNTEEQQTSILQPKDETVALKTSGEVKQTVPEEKSVKKIEEIDENSPEDKVTTGGSDMNINKDLGEKVDEKGEQVGRNSSVSETNDIKSKVESNAADYGTQGKENKTTDEHDKIQDSVVAQETIQKQEEEASNAQDGESPKLEQNRVTEELKTDVLPHEIDSEEKPFQVIEVKDLKETLAEKQNKEKKRISKQKISQKKFGQDISDGKSKTKDSTAKTKKHLKIEKPSKKQKDKREDDSDKDDSSQSEDVSISSPTAKTHKSFRVLDEANAEVMKPKRETKKRSEVKESRSRSQENKKKDRSKERDKFRYSKIPTPLGRKILSKSDRHLDKNHLLEKRALQGVLNARVPSLPNIHHDKDRMKEPPRSESNMSAPLLASLYSDNESISDAEHDSTVVARNRKRIKKRPKIRDARSAGSDYESSNLIDSGFEPSPRSTRIPKWRNMSSRGVNMTSVTQNIQNNIRRYHLERKIFQHLLELKRHQIRAGQHNEAVLVKRAIDAYHQSCASTVGAGRYIPEDFTFKSFERFLYESLRKLQKNDVEYLTGLPEAPANPLLCTRSTNRCMHATHAYTGVPCAAYLPKMDHHTIPKIGYNNVSCKPGTGGFLPHINSKKAVTLELSHGTDKQVISLPTDRLDHNKRYYVTFTVKGHEPSSSNGEEGPMGNAHMHSKSD